MPTVYDFSLCADRQMIGDALEYRVATEAQAFQAIEEKIRANLRRY